MYANATFVQIMVDRAEASWIFLSFASDFSLLVARTNLASVRTEFSGFGTERWLASFLKHANLFLVLEVAFRAQTFGFGDFGALQNAVLTAHTQFSGFSMHFSSRALNRTGLLLYAFSVFVLVVINGAIAVQFGGVGAG